MLQNNIETFRKMYSPQFYRQFLQKQSKHYSTKEVADMLGAPLTIVQKCIWGEKKRQGTIPSSKGWYITAKEVEELRREHFPPEGTYISFKEVADVLQVDHATVSREVRDNESKYKSNKVCLPTGKYYKKTVTGFAMVWGVAVKDMPLLRKRFANAHKRWNSLQQKPKDTTPSLKTTTPKEPKAKPHTTGPWKGLVPEDYPGFMPLSEAARKLGVTYQTLFLQHKNGEIDGKTVDVVGYENCLHPPHRHLVSVDAVDKASELLVTKQEPSVSHVPSTQSVLKLSSTLKEMITSLENKVNSMEREASISRKNICAGVIAIQAMTKKVSELEEQVESKSSRRSLVSKLLGR